VDWIRNLYRSESGLGQVPQQESKDKGGAGAVMAGGGGLDSTVKGNV
jgi:hypothetical protein